MLTIPAVPRFSARGQDVPLKSETSGRSQYWLFTSFVAVLRKYGFLQHMPLITSMNISTRYTVYDGFYIISWTFDGGRTKIDMPYIYWFFWLCIGHEMREEWHTIYIGFYRISCTRAAKIPMQSIFRAWYWSFAAGITQKVKGMSEKNNINGIYKNYRACRYFRHLGPGCDRDERHVVENIGSTNISDTLEQGGLKKFRHIIYIYFL